MTWHGKAKIRAVRTLSTLFCKYANVLSWLPDRLGLWHREDRCFSMPRSSPFFIRLSSPELAELQRRAAKYTLPYFKVQRAKMILMAAQGLSNDEIARRLDTRRDVVSMWR